MQCSKSFSALLLQRFLWYQKTSRLCYSLSNKINSTSVFSSCCSYCFARRHFSSSENKTKKRDLSHVPNIKEFISSINQTNSCAVDEDVSPLPPYLENVKYSPPPNGKTVYFETYGCQMNVNDAEYAWAILKKAGYKKVDAIENVSLFC